MTPLTTDQRGAPRVVDARCDVGAYECGAAVLGIGSLAERAFVDRSYVLVEYLNTDERLESLRPDPRFVDLRRRTGLPELH
ncbi:MAG: choice-of-anchor Q domain-containing protein [Lysobacterales bacterium]